MPTRWMNVEAGDPGDPEAATKGGRGGASGAGTRGLPGPAETSRGAIGAWHTSARNTHADNGLASIAQRIEDNRGQTLGRGPRRHGTCSLQRVDAKGGQFARGYIDSDGTACLGLGQQVANNFDQSPLWYCDVLALMHERAKFWAVLVPFEGNERVRLQHRLQARVCVAGFITK